MTDRLTRLKTTRNPWLADGGLETSILFHDGIDIPHFASLFLLESDEGRAALDRYFDRYAGLAKDAGTGFVLDTATWRSGAYWADTLGRSADALRRSNREAVEFARRVRARHETEQTPIPINGVVGPAGDGYAPDALYSPEEAERVHAPQIAWLAEAGVDLVAAITFTHPGEAIGFLRAAKSVGVPAFASFTVETDGRLPSGQTIREAVEETDRETDASALWFMINCAHPDHFSGEVEGDWTSRIGGLRANASRMSHAELDAAEELDDGDPEEFGTLYGALAKKLPNLRIVGGCCGTDDRHVGCAARHVLTDHHQPAA